MVHDVDCCSVQQLGALRTICLLRTIWNLIQFIRLEIICIQLTNSTASSPWKWNFLFCFSICFFKFPHIFQFFFCCCFSIFPPNWSTEKCSKSIEKCFKSQFGALVLNQKFESNRVLTEIAFNNWVTVKIVFSIHLNRHSGLNILDYLNIFDNITQNMYAKCR